MKNDFLIIPECYIDTLLVETLVPPNNRRGYNHQMGCNKVSSKMQNDLKNDFALGIIDKDKRIVPYIEEFELLVSFENIFLFKHKRKHHYFIQINPAIEAFLLKVAEDTGIDTKEFGVPNSLNELKSITKKKTSKDNPNLKSFIKDLKNKNAPQIVTLTNWISYLKTNTYHSDINEIKNI